MTDAEKFKHISLKLLTNSTKLKKPTDVCSVSRQAEKYG